MSGRSLCAGWVACPSPSAGLAGQRAAAQGARSGPQTATVTRCAAPSMVSAPRVSTSSAGALDSGPALESAAHWFNNSVPFGGSHQGAKMEPRRSSLEQQRAAAPPAAGPSPAPAATAAATRCRRRQRLVRASSSAVAEAAPAAPSSSPAAAAPAARPAAGAAAGGLQRQQMRPPQRQQQHRLSAAEEQQMAAAVAAGGADAPAAVAALVEANRALVQFLARRFLGRGLAREDLVAEGTTALERAARKYRPGGEARFGTYAATTIWQAMQRAVHNLSRDVRLPAHHHMDMSRVAQASKALAGELHGQPTCQQIAERCGLTIPYTAHLLRSMMSGQRGMRTPLRPELHSDAGPGDTLEDALYDGEEYDGEQQEQAAAAALRSGLEKLDPKQAMVVALRWGLADGETHTLRAIGERMGYTGAWASAQYKAGQRQLESIMRGTPTELAGQLRHAAAAAAGEEEAINAKDALIAAVARLSREDAQLLALRWGWLDGHKCTFKEIGKRMCFSSTWAACHYKEADGKLQALLPKQLDGRLSWLLHQEATGQQQWYQLLVLQQQQQQLVQQQPLLQQQVKRAAQSAAEAMPVRMPVVAAVAAPPVNVVQAAAVKATSSSASTATSSTSGSSAHKAAAAAAGAASAQPKAAAAAVPAPIPRALSIHAFHTTAPAAAPATSGARQLAARRVPAGSGVAELAERDSRLEQSWDESWDEIMSTLDRQLAESPAMAACC